MAYCCEADNAADIDPRHERKPLPPMIQTQVEGGDLEARDPAQLLTWAIESFHPRLALSCSFGDPEGMVLLDMMHRIETTSRVFVLDTGRMHQATYDLIDRVRDRYDIQVEVVLPDSDAVQEMVRERGVNLFYESLQNRRLCCRLRKVERVEFWQSVVGVEIGAVTADYTKNIGMA